MKLRTILLFIVTSMFFFSCSRSKSVNRPVQQTQEPQARQLPSQPAQKPSHTWYYFSGASFFNIDTPYNAPQILKKPWTESIRISSSLSVKNDSKEYDVYFTVNRSGLLIAKPSLPKKAVLAGDTQLFSKLTAGSLVCVDGFPVFHTYRNSFFSSKDKIIESLPFLVQFHPETSIFLPLLYTKDLQVMDEAQVTDVQYTAGIWVASVKTETNDKTKFDYINFFSYEPLVQFSPAKRNIVLETNTISAGEYRKMLTPAPFASAPARLKELYKRLPVNFPFYASVALPDGGSAVTYLRGSAETDTPLPSQALLADTFSLAIFADGTCFFAGALPNNYILANGEPVAFRLPKLPNGFTYGNIGVSGTTLYISWEEGSFYETGRSGFLTVDLKEILY